jgi:uncharacterized protein
MSGLIVLPAVAEIKQAGGITMVQSPEDAEFASMPRSAIAYGGIVDVIAPTTELARAVECYVYGLEQRASGRGARPAGAQGDHYALRATSALPRATIARRKGIETGIMNEPRYRVWMQDYVRPQPPCEERPGRWIAEAEWPSARILERRYHLNPGRLEPEPTQNVALSFSSLLTTGLRGGEWCPSEGELPLDQRPDDCHSLTFDTPPLSERVEILGAPVLELDLAADAPSAMLAVRLNDLAPDGTSLLVSYGLLNLTHRESHAAPAPLEPGKTYRVCVQLNDVAHAFGEGHCLRIAITTSYWPMAWPSPARVVLTMGSGSSTLRLPVRPPSPQDEALRPFEPPLAAPESPAKPIRRVPFRRTLEVDLATNQTVLTLVSGEFDAALARIEQIEMDLGYTV